MKLLVTLSVPDDSMVRKDDVHYYVGEMARRLGLEVDSIFSVEPRD